MWARPWLDSGFCLKPGGLSQDLVRSGLPRNFINELAPRCAVLPNSRVKKGARKTRGNTVDLMADQVTLCKACRFFEPRRPCIGGEGDIMS